MESGRCHLETYAPVMYPVCRGLLTSQSQLLAKIPPILAFFDKAPVT